MPRLISECAVVKRVNRRLAREDQILKCCRFACRNFHYLGRYYVVDGRTNFLATTHVNLDDLAREVRAMRPCEAIADG